MSVLDAPYYCHEQIHIPADLPDILKEFTKAAIKTQPSDLVRWSAAYFRALSNGEQPPVSDRLSKKSSFDSKQDAFKLTQELLAILNKQLGPKKIVPLSQIQEKWQDLCMPVENFDEIVGVGHFQDEVEWFQFFGLACSAIGKDLEDSIRIIGEILSNEPPGKEPLIPYTVFKHYFEYLGKNDGMAPSDIDNILQRIFYAVEKEDGMVNVNNFMSLAAEDETITLED